MELINRYVHQVGRRLPKAMRADVEEELRSLLLDALEERADGSEGLAVDNTEAQVAVLTEFGPPDAMADKYQPRPQYVVGPKTYRIYLIVVAALLLAGFAAAVVTTAVSALAGETTSRELAGLIGRGVGLWWNIFISGVGMATLVFALLERVVPDMRLDPNEDEVWNPRDLPAIEQDQGYSRASLIAEIVFTAIALVLFGAFSERINMGVYYSDGWHTVPGLLSAAFMQQYLPLMFVRWVLTIVLDLVLLRQGRWQLGTRLGDLALRLIDVGLLSWLLLGPSVLDGDALRAMLPMLDSAALTVLDRSLRLAFLLGLVGTLVEIVKKVLRMADGTRQRRPGPAA